MGSSVGVGVGLWVGYIDGEDVGSSLGEKETVGWKVFDPNFGKNLCVGL